MGEPKATDPQLRPCFRFDMIRRISPIAILVNFAAHLGHDRRQDSSKYSADYPGFMKNRVEAELATKCVFMQGASGDMSPNVGSGPPGPQGFGQTLADSAAIASWRSRRRPEVPPIKVSQRNGR